MAKTASSPIVESRLRFNVALAASATDHPALPPLPIVTRPLATEPPVGLRTDTHLDKTPPRATKGLDLVKSGWTYNCMECHKLFAARWHYDVVTHQKHGPLTADKLDALLHNPDCLRHPVRLIFEFGEMAMHQFAQPDIDWRNTEHDGRVLYVRPLLRERPDLLMLAVAYMIPLINYGDIISEEHCLHYGGTLMGLMEAEYYQQMCALADFIGAEARIAGQAVYCGV